MFPNRCFPAVTMLICLSLAVVSGGCDGTKDEPSRGTGGDDAPPEPLAFHATDVPGVSIAADEPGRVRCEVLSVAPGLGEGVTALSPLVLIEPTDGGDPPRGIRFTLPDDAQPAEPSRVALAFNALSFSQSQKRAAATWHVHAADYDPETRTVTARVGHASVWVCVDPKVKRESVASDRFRIHYWPHLTGTDFVVTVNQALVQARKRLEGMGLSFGWEKDERLDVYLDPIPAGNRGVVYAEHRVGKSGGRCIMVNLPSNIPNFSRRELRVTVAHELFHELQYRYENISTFQDVWLPGAQRLSTSWLNPPGKLVDAIYPQPKYDYPLGWLNEALSTWFQLDFDAEWTPSPDDPLYGNAQDFLTGGLGGLKTDNGYGGAVFIDYMVRRSGREFIRELLRAVQRQGRERNALAAVKEAALKVAVLKQDPELATFDPLWRDFATNLLLEDAKRFDRRIDRRKTVAARNQPRVVPVGDEPKEVQLDMTLAPLSALVSGVRVQLSDQPERGAEVVCTITQTLPDDAPFAVVARPIGTPPKMGGRALAPAGSRVGALLTRESPTQTLRLPVPDDRPEVVVRLAAVGIWAGNVPASTDRVTARYELRFALAEPEPADEEDAGEATPASTDNVITGVYYGELQTNTRRSGLMMWIVDAQERFVLRNAYEILSEKKDDFGNVVETHFRFRKGMGSPPIPPGRYRICAGPRVGRYYAKSEPFTVRKSSKVRVIVGTPPAEPADE
ncbi:MAG: hypothetical protein KGY99_10905 [Phycisphaerae bacterium]|nr:hypothetical protein [Phycisphaerae bacterium]